MANGQPFLAAKTDQERFARLQRMFDRGLRAQLRTGNILTGQQYVTLDFYPDAPKFTLNLKEKLLEFPSIPGSFDDIDKSVASIVKNTDKLVKKLDEETLPEFNKTIKNADNLLASDSPLQMDLRDTLRELTKAASALKKLADTRDQQPQSILFGKPSEEAK